MKKQKRAIIIDNNPGMAEAFKCSMELLGYQAEAYLLPEDYSEKYDKLDCDVLIINQNTPDMTGSEFIRMYQDKGFFPRKTALMSVIDDPEIQKEAEDLNCDFITKPIEKENLQAWLNS